MHRAQLDFGTRAYCLMMVTAAALTLFVVMVMILLMVMSAAALALFVVMVMMLVS